MNYSEDNYGHGDPYGSQRALQGRDGYNPYGYSIENNSYSDRPDLSPNSPGSHDGRSSRLQQNSSPRIDMPRGRGSLSSNTIEHSNDPYMSYQPGLHSDDSPRGADTPTRFHSYNDTSHDSLHFPASHSRFGVDASDNYHHSQLHHLSPYGSRMLDDPHSRSSFNEQTDHGPPSYNPGVGDRYHDNSFQDHYNDEQDQYGRSMPPPQNPYNDDEYGRNTPQNRPYIDEQDHYERNAPQNKEYIDPHYSDSNLNNPSHYNGYPDNYVDNHSVDQNLPQESPYAQRRDYPPGETGRYHDPNYIEDPYHRSDSYREQPSRNYEHDSYEQNPYPNDGDTSHRYEGLPPVSNDPFADDPFQHGERLNNQEDPYGRISPSAPPNDEWKYGDRGPEHYDADPTNYDDQSPQYAHDVGPYGDEQELPGYEDDRPDRAYPVDPSQPYLVDDELHPVNQSNLGAPPDDYHLDGRSPSDGNRTLQWRNPDLQEVIDYLSHPRDNMKANAAAYLQHLCFMDNDIKAKTRGLDGIPPLIELLNNEFPEVHKNACGALKNLSYGKSNEENKKSIKNAGGIPALVRLLRKTQDDEIKDLVTGILWNLSSSEDLKAAIVDDTLAILVNSVILPQSGWEKRGVQNYQPWTTVFRNSTGVLRNVSSAGIKARTKLRECHGLVESLIYAIKSAIDVNDIDNKPVENCVCILRNLSFRIQEIDDPEFYKKRQQVLQQQKTPEKGENTGCFGGVKKKPQNHRDNPNQSQQLRLPPRANEYKGLWHPETIKQYLKLLRDSTNPVTIEASTGAIQNLAACDWQPSADVRAVVRREKGLPWVVDLLTYDMDNSDKVVCSAATALRNLAIDDKNKELVGKYAMRQLVSMLPQDSRSPHRIPADDILCAVIATLYEAIKDNGDFGQVLLQEGGLLKLINMKRSEGIFNTRTLNYCVIILKAMWQFKALHFEYTKLGLVEEDFMDSHTCPRSGDTNNYSSNHTTPYGTMSHPISRQGYDDTTLSSVHQARRAPPRGPGNAPPPYLQMDGTLHQGYSNPSLNHDTDRRGYPQDHGPARGGRHEEVPMADLGPGYAPIDDGRRSRQKPPAGGVALFPNQQSPDSVSHGNTTEPLYAQVNKNNRRRQEIGDVSGRQELVLNGGGGGEPGGADSWV